MTGGPLARRLRLHGLIERVVGSHRYSVTATGFRVAFFYNTLQHRLLQIGGAEPTQVPAPLRPAVRQLHAALDRLWPTAEPGSLSEAGSPVTR